MLYRNDVFTQGDVRMRLLHVEGETAWVMPLGVKGWPVSLPWRGILHLEAVGPTAEVEEAADEKMLAPTDAMTAARDNALALLGELPNRTPEVFDPSRRHALVQARSREAGCAPKTLWKHLRRWWEGGQTPAALLGQFHRSGRPGATLTNKRGVKPSSGYDTYQLTAADTTVMRSFIDGNYLKDERTSIASTFQRLLESHYRFEDGNGKAFIRPLGERPSLRQFEYLLRTQYPLEVRLRKRKGDKDFERDDRGVLGTVLDDCAGVGHYYEADATIADVYLVADSNVNQIVGKPTLYYIIDRKSRLIAGWYVGLENPSWVCARQALLSISEDKRAMCVRYGVEYNASDWPAHQVFPQQVLADRGELFTKAASQLAENLNVTVTNVPSKRGDWKPVVECGFKQTRMTLQDGTPGFDPPENAKRRQGKKYEKDACLTLREFAKLVLLAIIKHNRAAMEAYPLNLRELASGVHPSPIGIWNHNVVDRAGMLPRYTVDAVRLALLPQDEATVTEHGILFNGCYYSCQAAMTGGWFVQARRRRTQVLVSYDGRLVDSIVVHDPAKRGATHQATLLPRSQKYSGLSFAEVTAFERLRAAMRPDIRQDRIQAMADFNDAAGQVTATALTRLKKSRNKVSRSARKADTKPARQAELRVERQELAAMPVAEREESATVISFPGAAPRLASPEGSTQDARATAGSQAQSPTTDKPLSMADRIRMAREKMLTN
jgi:putative transposase